MKPTPSSTLFRSAAVGSALAVCLGFTACGHKAAPAPPAPPTPPAATAPAPTVTLTADPTSLVSGASATLTWTSANATSVDLNGQVVNLNGSQPAMPTESTDYEIVAHGANGQTADAAVRITVTQPTAPTVAPTPTPTDTGTFDENVRDAFFDYDKADIRPDAQTVLQADAAWLKSHPGTPIRIIGHCDERGSAEYNLALGDRRADAVKNYLVSQGVDANAVTTVSVGKEQPFCTEQNDDCYQKNRVGHLTPGGNQ